MKNRLFYGLFVVYAVMVAFVLYANGIFTGNVESWSNLVINGVFLVIIGVLFLISSVSFMRLNRLTDDLQDTAEALLEEYKKKGNKNLWEVLPEKKNIFDEGNLQEAFRQYRAQVEGDRRSGKYKAKCDIEDYINEQLLDKVGKNYFNSGISGTLTGLGILGTFIGLSLGLGSFNGDDIYTISDNVGPLLSGMKVAFHTSVYGILLSLVFSFVYRSVMADAYEKLDFFLGVFRQCAMPPAAASGDENVTAMLLYQANTANYLRELLELLRGESAGQTRAMEKMADHFLERLQAVMNTDFKELGSAMKAASHAQASNAEGCRTLLEAVESLNASSREMHNSMAYMLDRQEQLAGELERQGQALEEACREISSDVSNQLYTLGQMRKKHEN